MAENNVQLIQKILDGEKEAFSILVQKYQKRIHALAWRKIGDYHIAEEITQDTFLKVYKKLPTLKNPKQFDGWIYVIANRLCINWIQRNKTPVQSIEDTSVEEMEKSFYNHYESEQRKIEATAHNRTIVKKLLEKLPESERTVLTLYYLGEMTAQEISKFLGVSVNTIKSRLRRARNRLKGEEELLITENLGSVQLSTDLTESIMRQVVDIKPSPPVAKPWLPWAAFGTATILVMLLLGAINQYVAHFQKPYNFEALSEPTIEIVESPIHIDIVSKPTVRNKIGRGVTNNRNEGAGAIVSNTDSAANAQENSLNSSVVQWTQANGPQGSSRFNIFATSENSIHAVSSTSIYRLMEDETTWMNINSNVPINTFRSLITEHRGITYSVNADEISASTDGGGTWSRFCSRPNGNAVGLIIRNKIQESFTMYLAMQDKGIFRSVDAGKKWISLNNGLTGKRITAVAAIGDSVFIGTNRGLYRLNTEVWNLLPVDPLKTVHSIAVFEDNLYVVTGPDFLSPESLESNSPNQMSRRIFHSSDSGSTWREITPEDKSFVKKSSFEGSTKITAFDKTLLVLGVPAFRSRDGGQTWTNLGFDINLLPSKHSSVLAVNENTFYKVGPSGIIRTTDGGDSWHQFMNGMVNTDVQDLVAFNNKLYVYTGTGFFKSADDGNSWEEVHIDYGEFTPKPTISGDKHVNYFTDSKLIIANNVLYAITPRGKELHIFRLRPDDDVFLTVHRISSPKLRASGEEVIDTNFLDSEEGHMESSGFAVSGETFYVEYRRRLFKWTPGSIDVIDTGLTVTYEHSDKELKLAASAEVVYVGKQNGKLYQSLDGGNSWRDVTLNIPYSFSLIKDIKFVGSTVYVATDTGVISSQAGEHWRMSTDNLGTHIIIDRFATSGSNFYGAANMGVYRLDSRGKWEQISPNIPDKVVSLSASVDKLYIATKQSGIFYTSIEKESPDIGSTAISSMR